MRPRSQTLGAVGRSRSSRLPATVPPKEPPPERGAVRRWIHGALFDNIGIKFLSLVLAVTVFLLVNTDKEREIRVRVPVEYKSPPDKVMTSEPINEVTVTIKGPWRRLRGFDERELDRITLDLSATSPGDFTDFTLRKELVTLPPGLSVVSVTPPGVRVAFDKRVEKTVEVVVVTAGRPQHGYLVAEQKVLPATVRVRGGERLLAALTQIRTHEISVQNRAGPFDTQIDLAPPAGVEADRGQRVTVHVRIEQELVTKRVPGIPVMVRGEGVDPAKWAVQPAQLEVTLTGALLSVEKADHLVAYVHVTPADARPREAEVVIEGIPPGVDKRISPVRVKVIPASPPRGIP